MLRALVYECGPEFLLLYTCIIIIIIFISVCLLHVALPLPIIIKPEFCDIMMLIANDVPSEKQFISCHVL